MMGIQSITDVTEKQLCTGCGACAYMEPKTFQMAEFPEYGYRPVRLKQAEPESGVALDACPGYSLNRDDTEGGSSLTDEYSLNWGPVLGVWEGFASNDEVRYAGSSGGALTALALYGLETGAATGVLHATQDPENSLRNITQYSTDATSLISATGSRYAPASPCERLSDIESAPGQSVFVGKPCDVAAVHKARKLRPTLDQKTAVTIAFFCAGTPSKNGTKALLKKMGVPSDSHILDVRYRGNGWPGNFCVQYRHPDGTEASAECSYQESWGFLQEFRQWRCYICPDHTGEFADLSVGDPWYRELQQGELGRSLIVARTERGLAWLMAAKEQGFIHLERQDESLLPRSQPNLLETRNVLWGRLLALKLLAAVPEYKNFGLWRSWFTGLSLVEKFRTLLGTARRVFRKKLHTRVMFKLRPQD